MLSKFKQLLDDNIHDIDWDTVCAARIPESFLRGYLPYLSSETLFNNKYLSDKIFQQFIDYHGVEQVNWEDLSMNSSITEQLVLKYLPHFFRLYLLQNSALSVQFVFQNFPDIDDQDLFNSELLSGFSEELVVRLVDKYFQYPIDRIYLNHNLTENFYLKYLNRITLGMDNQQLGYFWVRLTENPHISWKFITEHYPGYQDNDWTELVENSCVPEEILDQQIGQRIATKKPIRWKALLTYCKYQSILEKYIRYADPLHLKSVFNNPVITEDIIKTLIFQNGKTNLVRHLKASKISEQLMEQLINDKRYSKYLNWKNILLEGSEAIIRKLNVEMLGKGLPILSSNKNISVEFFDQLLLSFNLKHRDEINYRMYNYLANIDKIFIQHYHDQLNQLTNHFANDPISNTFALLK